jgi:TetR/AcrR family transcriptional regulator, fatty acid metabolism regulator protein
LAVQPGKAEPDRTFIETARRAQIVDAAIDTIAEVGYARASLGRIAERAGISRGLISYHFAGKEEMISEIVRRVIDESRAYMLPRITAESTGPGMLRAYIESNLVFIREHRSLLIAIVEIGRHRVAEGTPRHLPDHEPDQAVRVLADLLARFQKAGDLRGDFDPRAVAIAIRAAIDAAPARLSADPQFDIDAYAQNTIQVFDLATRTADVGVNQRAADGSGRRAAPRSGGTS